MSRTARGFVALVGVTAVLAGAAGPAAAATRPFRAIDLGGLSDDGPSSAFAVNDKGAVVGTSQAPDGSTHGVLWRANGTLRDLGRDIYPVDINNRGAIIGTAGVGANATLLERSNPPPSTPTHFFRDQHAGSPGFLRTPW